ncbi:excalibur calcium-binding domain-containing protein [Peribacillus sp. SCS-26]|uniref:excalibur calcium-binding domain-containing protein n=1 Tax=Paraperibacillus marinus TaxID=3115295 RepID=UPI003906CD13
MNKTISVIVSAGLLLGLSSNMGTADAKTVVKTYKNCSELNKVYKGGVAISAKTKNKGGKTKNKPFAHQALYKANKKSDRDKDGIACEK